MHTIDRLIKVFIPEHYELSLHLDRTERKFNGLVTIEGTSTEGATSIRLHAKDLTIEKVIVDGKQAAFSIDSDELTITHDDITAGNYLVAVSFSGTITDPMHGLYPCYYEHAGIAKELLATQFESHHAREVFPCIDEPEAKATFGVTLTTEPGVTVLGNMPVKYQHEENGLLVTAFEHTPRMSTYLLAWVVGELHKATATTKTGTEVSVWATPAQSQESLTFALDIATRTIDFFNEYFDTPYPLPKSDHVALPDFSSGAMENWGLVTYREVALLADPATASIENKRQVALVVAHELSHQWFGNLVTMEWWNDLWLNESFANMMEYVAIDAIEPSWNIWLEHASSEVIQALRRDSLEGVQAIQTDVNHPDEISTLFDPSIVYAKGGRLLRMLQAYIGTEALQEGLKNYFKQYAYQNTVADDLWRCLGEASGKDISTLMQAWIGQSGYPVVTISRDGDQLHLAQEQFFIGEHQPSKKLWPIPLASTNDQLPALFSESSLDIAYSGDDIPVINHNAVSHFITDYSPDLRPAVFASIDSLSEIDRLKLLTEHTLLAQSGRITPSTLLDLLENYRTETSEAVWGTMSLVINDLKKYVEDDEAAEDKLREFVRELARQQYERLGWEKQPGESEEDTKLRSLIISLSLYGRNEDAEHQAEQHYAAANIEQLDPDLRVAIMAHVVRVNTSATIVDNLLQTYMHSSSSELREDIAAALTSTKDIETGRRLLATIKDTSVVRAQDVMRWFVWLLANRHIRSDAWQWVRSEWSWLEEMFGSDKSYDIYPRYIASLLTKQTQLDEYREFFTPLMNQVALKRNIEIGLVELSHRVSLIEREAPAVRTKLLEL